MVEEWVLEFLKAIGRFFLHPLTYYFIAYTLLIGFIRVKKERRDFHVRIYDSFLELRSLFSVGLFAGAILSIVTIGVGIVLTLETLVIVAIITLILSFMITPRLLTPANVLGLTFFSLILLPKLDLNDFAMLSFSSDQLWTSLSGLAILLALFMIMEGFLIWKKGGVGTSPYLKKSKRGLQVGAHKAQRIWMLPVLFLLPGEVITTQIPWWPVFSIGQTEYALCFVPFVIGFSMHIQGMHPSEMIQQTGKRVLLLSLIVATAAISSIWLPVFATIAVFIAILGREMIAIQQRLKDDSYPFYFSQRDHGLVVLAIISQSPAEKMAIQVGEMITKVNGVTVRSVEEFYEAIQKNSAFCKLEVIDVNGQVRFTQRALYDGEHHELGILFVQDDKKWDNEAV
ncbi:PDZ domain-containing protein [Cytobacillus sp. IB215316]|uniref:PDZ domain-containing protein n=1 Tax=Cytobacillus sp. IB215316 TaxID=3097354 RepID=UPI002A119173|nr:PDZ domain-containing protein [Cytobacillus sp. IB215316]MDX8360590.1 PDZ domain-containing protein [Cytobacillus sp. IB215316]